MNFTDRCVLATATLGPIGYMPGGGTWASLCTLGTLCLLNNYSLSVCLYSVGIVLCAGVALIEHALKFFDQEDPPQIVFDELMGISVAFILSNKEPACLVITFFLFRVLDIVKPRSIGAIELAPGVLGVVGDDLMAGFFAAILSRIVLDVLYMMNII